MAGQVLSDGHGGDVQHMILVTKDGYEILTKHLDQESFL